MNVCILSMQRINNMGSLLQAYALKRILESMGCYVEFIDIKKIDEDYLLLGDQKENYNEAEKNGLIGKISKIDRYIINRARIRHAANRQQNIFETFRTKNLNLDRKLSNYDLCIIGSDEVFNCLNAGDWGFTSQLFGNVPEAKVIITYAASCGATKYENLPPKVINKIKQAFGNIKGFSVRDQNTYDFVRKLTNEVVSINLDPVLVYDFNKELELIDTPADMDRYCIIYSYYNRIHTKDEIDAIEGFCKANHLTPIALGAPQFWLKRYIVCSPFECLNYFKYSSFVITDTFHGAVFSLKYAKKYAIMPRPSNYNKLVDLVNRLDISRHLVSSFWELDNVYNAGIIPVQSSVSEEAKLAIGYLGGFIEHGNE